MKYPPKSSGKFYNTIKNELVCGQTHLND